MRKNRYLEKCLPKTKDLRRGKSSKADFFSRPEFNLQSGTSSSPGDRLSATRALLGECRSYIFRSGYPESASRCDRISGTCLAKRSLTTAYVLGEHARERAEGTRVRARDFDGVRRTGVVVEADERRSHRAALLFFVHALRSDAAAALLHVVEGKPFLVHDWPQMTMSALVIGGAEDGPNFPVVRMTNRYCPSDA